MALKVFISYSQQDRELCQALENHLSNLKRQGVIASWSDGALVPGTEWEPQILHHLNTAHIILLLVSADFMASDFCYSVEMTRALERHQANQARVIPILLRPTDWHGAPFATLQMLPRDGEPITMWLSLDAALAHVVQGIRAAIDDLTRREQTRAPSAMRTLPAIWNIPYPRNPYFTGREDLLTELAAALRAGQTMGSSQPQAISGMGGVGKTQIALEYAYHFHQDYDAVLWTRADTQEALISGFVAFASLLSLPLQEERDQLKIVQAVKACLTTHTRWLLILDNADDLSLLSDFLPLAGGGHILLTTRAANTGRMASRIEVDTLDKEPGALLLLHRTGRLTPDATLEQATASDRATALEITEELGGLPLALDQAGAYIEEIQCSLADYLQLYRSQRAAVLKARGGLVPDHPEPVATAWSLSFAQIEQRSPAAADLLRLCAFLHPDAIPEVIITEGADYFGPELQRAVNNAFAFDQALGVLLSYSLLKRNADEHLLSIHRLVQAVLKDGMDAPSYRRWAERTVQAVNAALPDEVEQRTTARYERCLPHAQECALLIEQLHFTSYAARRLLQQTGSYLYEHARYAEAEACYQHSLRIREQALGPNHRNVATTLTNLAILYWQQGKYAQAEPLYQRALRIWEQTLGPNHPDVAYSLNNLANLHKDQGRYAEAESLYQRALRIREQTLELDHPQVAYPLNGLANLYKKQGKYAQAEPLYQRALRIWLHALGPDHPRTRMVVQNYASLLRELGREAEALHLEARFPSSS